VTVEAGIRVHQLQEVLARHGLALPTRGAISRQSLAGAISTGTHGSSLKFGCLSSLVTALRIIDGEGNIVVASATQNPEVFNAARVGYGVVGIISTITLEVVDTFYLKKEERSLVLEEALTTAPQLLANSDYFFWFWVPTTNFTRTLTWNRVSKEAVPQGFGHSVERFLQTHLIRVFTLAATYFAWFPGQITSFYSLAETMLDSPVDLIAESSFVFEVKTLPDYTFDAEYYLPLKDCEAAFRELQKEFIATGHYFNLNGVISMRFVKGDDIWMSPFYETDSCAVDVFASRQDAKPDLLAFLDKVFSKFNARAHPGKLHAQNPDQ